MRAALGLVLIGCSGSGLPPAAESEPPLPQANDPAFAVEGLHSWYLIPDGTTQNDQTLTLGVTAPAGSRVVDAWVGPHEPVRLTLQDGVFAAQVSIADLPAGTYNIVVAADGESTAFGAAQFHRSAAYYVLVSTDWDFSDPGVYAIGAIDFLHMNHPIVMTDFVGPYTFTDPAVTPDRANEIATWLQQKRDQQHDEIGLHIHPYCNFVTDAGVTCITDRSTVYADGDTSGYTIELDAYANDQLGVLLDHAAALFAQHGLGQPRTFRAGGWTATIDTLGVLAQKGYIADSSALNWARIEEWKGVGNDVLYTWNMEHWNPIDDTSQPYAVSQTDILASTPPDLPVLEVPDNGVMIDYVTLPQMTGLFDTNWNGAPLDHPITLMMGFHPSSTFSPAELGRVDGFLSYADKHLATRDLGPVVYTTLSAVTSAFSEH